MPKRLMDCIKKVQESGKSESEAWAICTKSTGLKKEKHTKAALDISQLQCGVCGKPLQLVDQDEDMWLFHCETPSCGALTETDPGKYADNCQRLIYKEQGKPKHESIEEPMPGEVPSKEEMEEWFRVSAKRIGKLVVLANKLDDLNLPEEATLLDSTLEKEAQWQWMKEKGQQLKDWYQTEKEPQKQTRRTLTDFRQNHWNLVKKLNTAYQMLVKSHKNIGKPEYLRDITSMINYILKDIQKASAAVQTITTQPAQQPQGQPAAPQAAATPASPASPVSPVVPGASIGGSLVERLTKLADKLEAKGNKEAAKVVRAQWQAATEMGQKGMDWMLGRGESSRAQSDKQWSNFHWRVAGAFKSAYDKLNAVRQYLNDPNTYPERFQAVANEIQTDLNTILGEIQNAGKPAAQPAVQPAVQPADEGEDPFRSPSPDLTKTQRIQPADQISALMADMTLEQQTKAVELIKQLRGQTP
jgi:hypothetical protein